MKQEVIVVQPSIETKRMVLRPLRRSDQSEIAQLAGDVRIARTLPNLPHPFPLEAAQVFVTRAMAEERTEYIWAMDGSETISDPLIGLIFMNQVAGDHAELGYWVKPSLWNKGYAREAVRALIAANPLNNRAIFAEVFQDNPAAARVLEQSGFAYLGEAEAFCLARGTPVATSTYSRGFM